MNGSDMNVGVRVMVLTFGMMCAISGALVGVVLYWAVA